MIRDQILWQLINSNFPLGAYNYSEGLEYYLEATAVKDGDRLLEWLALSIQYGSIRVEGAVMLAAQRAIAAEDLDKLQYWHSWLDGTRETKELRQQSLQMGGSLQKLLGELVNSEQALLLKGYREVLGKQCHYAIAFALAITLWDIDPQQAILGYLHSWANNLMGAGVKIIPLGQTQGQKIMFQLHPIIATVAEELYRNPSEDDFYGCTWGLSLASMNHETQYTRLFRS